MLVKGEESSHKSSKILISFFRDSGGPLAYIKKNQNGSETRVIIGLTSWVTFPLNNFEIFKSFNF